MTRARRSAWIALYLLAGSACRSSPDDAVAAILGSSTAIARESRLKNALSIADSAADPDTPLARWVLPRALREVSGLALTRDGRLLVHGDENGQVWEVDYRRGVLLKRFSIGTEIVTADFEGITTAHDLIWLLASNGTLYEFREGANDAHVEYRKHDTDLKKMCEFEGLAFDSTLNALLLACKNIHEKRDRNAIVVYRWSLKGDSADRLSRLMVPVINIRGENPWTSLQISDITVDPSTGNYVLLASKERALIAITPTGEAVFARALPAHHEQPEGIAVTKDHVLIVSDEAAKASAIVTLYRLP